MNREAVKRVLRRNTAALCTAYLLHDWLWGLRLAFGSLTTRSGDTHAQLDLKASLAVIESTVDAYCRLAGVRSFDGDVAEVGPGDSLGVAMLLRARGARSVFAVDRFITRRDSDRQHRIYAALASRHGLYPPGFQAGWPVVDGIHYHPGQAAEEYFKRNRNSFDAILSNAVMEHLYDPLGALDDMLNALRPGGVMVHLIDLRDHGMFAERDPLTFLTIPEWLYRRMVRYSGRPNRILFADYRNWLEKHGLETDNLGVTQIVGEPEMATPQPLRRIDSKVMARGAIRVRALRPRFAPRIARHYDDELAVATCTLVIRKPSGARTDKIGK